MHILGLCNGSIKGNSEILLKAALKAAVDQDPSTTVSWMHVPSVALPRHHKPLKVDTTIIPDRNDAGKQKQNATEPDDREAAFNAIMDADALIIATPVYSHQPPGTLKALADAILGPYADVSDAHRIKALQESGNPEAQNAQIDPRELKPRVAGFIAVAGSGPAFPEQWTMALPTMHSVIYPLHARVIDQIVLPGFANAGSVLLDPENAIARAETLARRVASQMGRPFEETNYLGSEELGSCPYCHQLKLEFRQGNHVVCIVCGANGVLMTGQNGDIRPIWEEDSSVSCITLKGKWKHLDDIRGKLDGERAKFPLIARELDRWNALNFPHVDLPSLREKAEVRSAM
jgi:multimeric flavodoxin WrbA